MSYVLHRDDFSYRVNYAVQCLVRGTRSRRLDGCFEMDDGEIMITALVRRADKNAKLRSGIARQWSGEFPQSWRDIADKYADIKNSDLEKLAKEHRDAADSAWTA